MKTIITYLSILCVAIYFVGEADATTIKKDTLRSDLIDLKAVHKPLSEVLTDLEKKTGYQIELSREFQRDVTIDLKGIPLQKSIERLLSGLNHSVVFDYSRRTITIFLFDAKGKTEDSQPYRREVSVEGAKLVPTENPMAKVSLTVAAQIKEKELKGTESDYQPEKSPMLASTAAVEKYQIRKREGVQSEYEPEESPMSPSEAAVKKYKVLQQEGAKFDYEHEESPMSAVSAALTKYNNLKQEGAKSEYTPEKSPMSASTEAIKKYSEMHSGSK